MHRRKGERGELNEGQSQYPLPQWKGNFYVEWDSGPHNIRVQTNYIDGEIDQRTAPYNPATPQIIGETLATAVTLPLTQNGKKVDSFVTTDITYRAFLPWDTTAVFNIGNIFDQDPSFARLSLNYDPYTTNPLGRTYKLSLTKKF